MTEKPRKKKGLPIFKDKDMNYQLEIKTGGYNQAVSEYEAWEKESQPKGDEMELEDQVTSLEISKKLKGLGVKQESLFYWVPLVKEIHKGTIWYKGELKNESSLDGFYSAYTVAELGELIVKGQNESFQNFHFICGKWTTTMLSGREPYIEADTEANARGKILIYLLENKLMEVKDD